MAKAIGGETLPHPKKIARLWFPQYLEHTTPMHQDFVHFQGSLETLTFWSAIGDCPIELGGLALVPRFHKIDRVIDHHFSLGAGGLAIEERELDGEWHSIDYELGDALIFPSLTVHRALPNRTQDRLRISLDNRYQSMDVPISEFMLEPHLSSLSPLSWEDIYENWDSGEFQYYWRDRGLEVLPYMTKWREQAFEESLELGRLGDKAAQYSLKRIARREPDSELGQRASTVLSEVADKQLKRQSAPPKDTSQLSRAYASISTTRFGLSSSATTTIVEAGRILSKVSEWARVTPSACLVSVIIDDGADHVLKAGSSFAQRLSDDTQCALRLFVRIAVLMRRLGAGTGDVNLIAYTNSATVAEGVLELPARLNVFSASSFPLNGAEIRRHSKRNRPFRCRRFSEMQCHLQVRIRYAHPKC